MNQSDTHFKSLVPSIAISYILYNHEKEIQECIRVDDVLLYLQHLFTQSVHRKNVHFLLVIKEMLLEMG